MQQNSHYLSTNVRDSCSLTLCGSTPTTRQPVGEPTVVEVRSQRSDLPPESITFPTETSLSASVKDRMNMIRRMIVYCRRHIGPSFCHLLRHLRLSFRNWLRHLHLSFCNWPPPSSLLLQLTSPPQPTASTTDFATFMAASVTDFATSAVTRRRRRIRHCCQTWRHRRLRLRHCLRDRSRHRRRRCRRRHSSCCCYCCTSCCYHCCSSCSCCNCFCGKSTETGDYHRFYCLLVRGRKERGTEAGGGSGMSCGRHCLSRMLNTPAYGREI